MIPPALRAFVAAALLGALTLLAPDSPRESAARSLAPEDAALARGIEWLLGQQAADGGWHSSKYGLMQGGAGNTALALTALSFAPEEMREHAAPAIRRALDFLLSDLDETGFVRPPGEPSDYPTYATALTLSAMRRLKIAGWEGERRRMRDYLVAAQQGDGQGMPESDPQYGGWDRTGGPDAATQTIVETDIAVTRAALEALRDDTGLATAIRDRALRFLARCQNVPDAEGPTTGDSGFFFTPILDDPRNKAGVSPDEEGDVSAGAPRSYGSPTADGLRALRLCGVPDSDPRVRGAVAWFARHDSVDVVPGFIEPEAAATWGRGLTFYYAASLARVLDALPSDVRSLRSAALREHLVRRQADDGSWSNEVNVMREDDPLIATSLAVIALSTLRDHDAARPSGSRR